MFIVYIVLGISLFLAVVAELGKMGEAMGTRPLTDRSNDSITWTIILIAVLVGLIFM